MKTRICGIFAALLPMVATLTAQSGPVRIVTGPGAAGEFQFQQAGTIGVVSTGRVVVGAGAGIRIPRLVTGQPVSATEVQKSVQTLSDGTEISTSESNLFYRDSQGRTRVEKTVGGRTTITINDPVANVNLTLNADGKTALKQVLGPQAQYAQTHQPSEDTSLVVRKEELARVGTSGAIGGRGGRGGENSNTQVEDLGVQSINGVLASGLRTTLTIPQGQIGNNRDIHVVNERWYSEDLQMLVKTINSDPRFGESTYELTNVSRVRAAPGALSDSG